MTIDEEYNGWQNRETWAVYLWLSNDPDLVSRCQNAIDWAILDHFSSMARLNVPVTNPFLLAGDAVREVFDEWLEVLTDLGASSQIVNLLTDIGSLWRVDWQSIAKAFATE